VEFINIEVSHMQHALRGMRNAMSGWDKSDTTIEFVRRPGPDGMELVSPELVVGPSDRDLARRLIKSGAPHRKYMRQISVIVDICKMPSYFMHEFATYKVGTTADSSSTMHKITSRDLTLEDFEEPETPLERMHLTRTLDILNDLRSEYIGAKAKGKTETAEQIFRSIKRMLPHSYLYERITWTCSYENLIEIWRWRRNHRLPAWHEFCEKFIAKLPYAELITEYPYEKED
jgi:hypothetical protein